jgi:hypothetical protein
VAAGPAPAGVDGRRPARPHAGVDDKCGSAGTPAQRAPAGVAGVVGRGPRFSGSGRPLRAPGAGRPSPDARTRPPGRRSFARSASCGIAAGPGCRSAGAADHESRVSRRQTSDPSATRCSITPEEEAACLLALAANRLVDRRQRRADVAGELDVVEPDDAQVGGHRQADVSCSVDRLDGNRIAHREDGSGTVAAFPGPREARGAVVDARWSDDDSIVRNLDPGRAELRSIGAEPGADHAPELGVGSRGGRLQPMT